MLKKLKGHLKAILEPLIYKWYNLSSFPFEAKFGGFLRHLTAIVAALLVAIGCGTTKYVPIEGKEITKVEVRDSIIYKDSIIYIPQERIVEVVPKLDTLEMEIETAKAKAYLDTTQMLLKGELKSKQATQKKYIERIEYKERTDTVYIEKPTPYEVPKPHTPKWCWWSLMFNIVTVLLVAFRIYLKIKP